MSSGEPRWTIADLSERVSAALDQVEYEPPSNGQVRPVPDLRTIRYYTTLGLLDRPSAMKGRTALYGRRHLLQLVAVKRLQAQGMSLSEVQAALTGLDDGALAAIAVVPESCAAAAGPAPAADPAEQEAAPARKEARFWAARPAPAADPAEQEAAPARKEARFWAALPARAPSAGTEAPGRRPGPVIMMGKIALAPGVSLVIEPADTPGAFSQLATTIDPVELARAAAPLLAALRRHGLVAPDHEEEEPG